MAWSWRDNPITNTVKAGCRGTKNLAVKHVVNPTKALYKKVEKETKEHVIKPIKETADGIRQDPAAFVKDMKDGVNKSKDKVAQVIYDAAPKTVDAVLDNPGVALVDATVGAAIRNPKTTTEQILNNIYEAPLQKHDYMPKQNDQDMLFIAVYKDTPHGHVAVQYVTKDGNVKLVDFNPDREKASAPMYRNSKAILTGEARYQDKQDKSYCRDVSSLKDEDVEIYAIPKDRLIKFYQEKNGLSAEEAKKMVEKIPERMDQISKENSNWFLLGGNCVDRVAQVLGIDKGKDKYTIGGNQSKNALALPVFFRQFVRESGLNGYAYTPTNAAYISWMKNKKNLLDIKSKDKVDIRDMPITEEQKKERRSSLRETIGKKQQKAQAVSQTPPAEKQGNREVASTTSQHQVTAYVTKNQR